MKPIQIILREGKLLVMDYPDIEFTRKLKQKLKEFGIEITEEVETRCG